MKWMRTLTLAVVAGLGLGASSQASYFFEFAQADYEVDAGATVLVELYIVQDGPDTILSTLGLIAGFTTVTYNEAPFASDPAQVGSTDDIIANPLFNFTNGKEVVPATAATAGTASASYGTFEAVVASVDRILLGTYRFEAGLVVGEATSLRASIRDPSQTNFLAGDFVTVLDDLIEDGSTRISVVNPVVIPEPTSIALVGLALPTGWLAARRIRRVV